MPQRNHKEKLAVPHYKLCCFQLQQVMAFQGALTAYERREGKKLGLACMLHNLICSLDSMIAFVNNSELLSYFAK